ncbi:hypothetical protein H8356DRAFT_240935 [Neocallimastix lanati (nom. inval.)]|jgi:hypothetical protein|uniref:Uncharacterized protein n=1 Tax=Neocallimastix californiae TaxID=1754190 RepID=A0A1Y2A8P5_9FUNG|nr:hypothetical protein H8356DRAFT_240935 [Neocallimastix sp. JGI-2020a]ORY18889.1 hypothetical protein LY90DRAFT_708204 [Neocallimastix californiae]|eukprot:ORY18889.1 hypothetical protein LY90DRAFT_708204 [Neocallimastix californiae]
MNFKTLFLSAVALLSVVNAAPVNEKHVSIDSLKKTCKTQGGKLLVNMNDDSTSYACLKAYTENSRNKAVNPENSACFHATASVLCVDKKLTNIEQCIKSSDDYDYRKCSYFISTLNNNGTGKFKNDLRSYPQNERIIIDYIQDQKECKENGGIVLSYKVIMQYVCLTPVTGHLSLRNDHCVGHNGKVYCIDQDNTILEVCNKKAQSYNHDSCMSVLNEYSKANNFEIDEKGF